MRAALSIKVGLACSLVLAGSCIAAQSPGVRGYGSSPVTGMGVGTGRTGIGSVTAGTVPQSTFGGGLVRSPNPIDRSSNLIVTGNVAGGRHFRGIVPYNAISDFGGRLGSTQLDSFLRQTAGPPNYGAYAGRAIPYYSPTGTVTLTRPGTTTVIRPLSGGLEPLDRPYQTKARRSVSFAQYPRAPRSIRFRPLSMTREEIEEAVAAELTPEQPPMSLTARQPESLLLKQGPAETPQPEILGRDLLQDRPLQPLSKTVPETTTESPQRAGPLQEPAKGSKITSDFGPKATQPVTPSEGGTYGKVDTYEQTTRQSAQFRSKLEKLSPLPAEPRITIEQDPVLQGELPIEAPAGEQAAGQIPLGNLSGFDVSSRAKAILGPHKSFASYADEKFNRHISAAEKYLAQGRFYLASGAYGLASVYKPDEPLPYAGKSHALFAAGEYVSSAVFLARALQILPEYAQRHVGIERMVGGKDTLERRIADIERWVGRTGSPQLQFLLAYTYYQTGQLDKAEENIAAAMEKMPESPAVAAIKQAIDSANADADGTR